MNKSKASVHFTQPGGSNGFDDFLTVAAEAGNPVPVVYSVNGNIKPSILRCSQTTKIVYRRQTQTFSRLPDGFFEGDPVKNATTWMIITRDKYDKNRNLIENWRLNPADWYDPLNEPAPGTAAQAQWLNTWMLTALEIANSNGFKLALFSFPTGSPDYPLWPYLYPALHRGRELGAILSLHEYSIQNSMSNGEAGNVLRYRDVYESLPDDCKLPIIVSECGAGNGYDTGLKGQAWVNDLMWYNGQCCQDDYLLGFCAFQLGGGESNMVSALPSYARAISGFKCSEEVPPVTESADGTTVPPTPQIVDSHRHTWTLGAPSAHGKIVLRDGEQFAGGQGVLLRYSGGIVYAQNDVDELYMATENSWVRLSNNPNTNANGVDVALYQGAIDWQRARRSGTLFAFIKATQGGNITDPKFVANWTNAKAAGILRGAYHYYKFGIDPIVQANLFCSKLASDSGELPPVVDVEDTTSSADATALKRFTDAVTTRIGVKPIIYTAQWFWNERRWGGHIDWAKDYDLWVASYTKYPIIPTDFTTWKFWQYSNAGTVDGIPAKVDLDYFNGTEADLRLYAREQPITPPTPPTPANTYYGLGAGTQNEITMQQAGIYGSGFGADRRAAFKFLTLPDSDIMTRSIGAIKSKNSGAFLMARMFFSAGDTKFSPMDFVNYTDNGMRAAYQAGVLDYEVHNEPNLASEGMGLSWIDGYGFGAWLKEVITILKTRYSRARFWFPGLSPNNIAPMFLSQAASTPGLTPLLSGYCFHSYWYTEGGGAFNMTDETGGLAWKKCWNALPSAERAKPISISEFSNNSAKVSPDDKGQQYRRYRSLLQREGVHSAFSFVLYWDADVNREAWSTQRGGSTGILAGYLK
jgi:lysozyme